MKRVLNISPSGVDERDYTVSNIRYGAESKERYRPKVLNQGQTEMCMAYVIATMKAIHEYKERGIWIDFSPGYIYALRKSTSNELEGMRPRDAFKDLKRYGICEKDDFNHAGTVDYLEGLLYPRLKELMPKAMPNAINAYALLKTDDDVVTALDNDGCAMMAIYVYPSFYETGKDGYVPDKRDSEQLLGGHAMTIIDDTRDYWVVQNSWGESWGDNGICYIKKDYEGIMEMWSATDLPLVSRDDVNVYFQLDNKTVKVVTNDTELDTFEMDVAPTIIDGRIVVPAAWVAKAFGMTVKWLDNIKTAVFTKGD